MVQGKWIGCALEGNEVPDLGTPSSPHLFATLLTALSPNSVLKGSVQAEREESGCIVWGVAKFRGRNGTIRRRGADGRA